MRSRILLYFHPPFKPFPSRASDTQVAITFFLHIVHWSCISSCQTILLARTQARWHEQLLRNCHQWLLTQWSPLADCVVALLWWRLCPCPMQLVFPGNSRLVAKKINADAEQSCRSDFQSIQLRLQLGAWRKAILRNGGGPFICYEHRTGELRRWNQQWSSNNLHLHLISLKLYQGTYGGNPARYHRQCYCGSWRWHEFAQKMHPSFILVPSP